VSKGKPKRNLLTGRHDFPVAAAPLLEVNGNASNYRGYVSKGNPKRNLLTGSRSHDFPVVAAPLLEVTWKCVKL